jgi:class 3 adenylate cyclase/DNA-binding CsgD family transcriptional regulator
MSSPAELPGGTVTFVFTDIEGSTRLLKRLGGGYGDVLARHQSVIRAAFERHQGHELGTEGDALFFAFRRARDAIAAAVSGQLGLAGERWPAGVEVGVRMGVHTGEPRVEHGGYVGLVLRRAARISSAAHGGQVLLSSTTRELVADDLPDGIGLRDLGEHRLKDLDRVERIYELRWPGATVASPLSAPLATQVAAVTSPASSLVGRDQELAVIESALAAAGSGAGGLVLVEGSAGIGKTALLRASRERAAERGMTVLHARATELERDYPMGVVRECLEAAVREERDRDRLLRGAAALAAPVLLDVGDVPGTTPQALLRGLYWVVANLSSEAPVLLAVDDAQWADEASLRFLAYLARRLEDNAVAVLVGVRNDEEPGNGGAPALAEIRAAAAGRRVEPRPLDLDGVSRLLGDLSEGPVAPEFARACHEASGGNPFLLGELVRVLTADGVAFTAAGAARVTDVTPPTVARATAATLVRLGESAVVLAQAAAVLGGGVSLEQTARLAGLSAADAGGAAVALERAGIFDDDVLLEFRHPILAGAVRAGLSARERAAGHGRAVALLREQGAPPDRIGVHLLHASAAGDAQTVTDLRRAADHATVRGAPETAVALLRRALLEPPEPAIRAEVLIALGRAERAVGHTDEAAERLNEAYDCSADPQVRGRAVAALLETLAGSPAERRRMSEMAGQALADLADLDPELGLRLRAILILHGGSAEGLPLAGDSLGEAIVLGNLAFARMDAQATAAEIAGLAERAAPWTEELLRNAPSLAFSGMVLAFIWSDRLDAAARVLDHAIEVARRLGSATDYASAMTLRARVHQRAGRLSEAEADARAALEVPLDVAWFSARGSAPLIGSLLDQGRVDEASEVLVSAGLDGALPDTPPMSPVLLTRMRLRAIGRDYSSALADWNQAMRRAQAFWRARGLRGPNAGWIEDLIVVADVHRALGDVEAAHEAVEQALQLARRWNTPGAIGQALHAQARAGLTAEPVELLRAAVDVLAESPLRLEHARALVSLGSELRRGARRTDSRGPLREGYELARRCGARELAEHARAELRASGIRLHREALSGADSLTPSERRIADLARSGLANAEIAQDLFLTVKTVEMHLTAAYRKLDIRRRSELAGALG